MSEIIGPDSKQAPFKIAKSIKDAVHHIKREVKLKYSPEYREAVGLREKLRDDLRFLKSVYGLRVSMGRLIDEEKQSTKIVEADKFSLPEAVEAVSITRREIEKYPPEYIRYSNIGRLRLFKEMKEQECLSEKARKVPLGGRAVYENRVLYVATYQDVDFLSVFDPYADKTEDTISDSDRTFMGLPENLHHELFHRSDHEILREGFTDYEKKGGHISLVLTEISDPLKWDELNPSGKRAYLEERYELLTIDEKINYVKQGVPGFAKLYGMKDWLEDKATIAEGLMSDPSKIQNKAKKDAVLKAKIQRMMAMFKERSGGLMDEQYFQDLSEGRVKKGYWQTRT